VAIVSPRRAQKGRPECAIPGMRIPRPDTPGSMYPDRLAGSRKVDDRPRLDLPRSEIR